MAIITRWRWPPESWCGIGAEPLLGLGDADLRQKLEHAGAGGRVVHAAVQLQDLAHLLLDGVQRVERRHRLLEDDRDAVAADLAHLGVGDLEQVLAVEEDLARRMRRRRIGQEPHDRERGDRLAGARFADEGHRLAAADAEGGRS